jgi:hypothetical protein
MKSFIAVVPIVDGKLELWKEVSKEMSSNPKMRAQLKQATASRVRGWAAKNPCGDGMVAVVLHEGADLDIEKFMSVVMAPTDDAELNALAARREEVHGPMSPDAPPPLGEPVFDISID